MVYRPQETLPNNEDSNYIRNPFTSPTFAKMLTSPTQNEIANSQRKLNCACKNKIKKLKSCFTQSFKISPCLLFIQSSLSLLTST